MEREYSEIYYKLYKKHWWWRARERIILKELESLNLNNSSEILDIGCGNGLFFPKLSLYGKVTGIETDKKILSYENPFRKQIFHYPVGHDFYKKMKFDLILTLDVAEHIENDKLFFQEVINLMNKGGILMITVPSFQSLWDSHDEINNHFRRYKKDDLKKILLPYGKIVKLRYLFPSLFPVKYIIPKIYQVRSDVIKQSNIPNPIVNKFMIRWILFENLLLSNISIPFGTSLLVLFQKS